MSATTHRGAGSTRPGDRAGRPAVDAPDALGVLDAPVDAGPPPRGGVVLVAVGLVVAAALVAVAVLSLLVVALRQETSGGLEVQDVTGVRVDNRCGGDVEVTGLGYGETGQVEVAWDDAWSFGRPRHGRSVEAGRLVVSVACPPVVVGGSTSRLRVQVPGGVPVRVSAGAGAVTTTGLVRLEEVVTGSGDVAVTAAPDQEAPRGSGTTVRTGSGDVVLRGMGVALSVRTGSGDVAATDLTAPSVRVGTGSGDVDLRAVAVPQDVVARTGSGDVTVTVPDTPAGYAVSATTGSGATLVGVTEDPSSSLRMVLRTGSGDVEVLPGPYRAG